MATCDELGNRPLIDRARAVLADILTGNYLIGEGVNMEKVSIREASLRLHIPQSAIRQCIQDGELKACRQTCPDGRLAWVVNCLRRVGPALPWQLRWGDRSRPGGGLI